MKRHFPAVTLALAFLFAATLPAVRAQDKPAAVAADPELKLLQGTWEGVEKGKEAQGKCTLTIMDNAISFKGANPQEWYKGTIVLRGSAEPKQLDGTILDCPQPDFIGKTSPGIYKLEGDTLTLAGRQPGSTDGPKSFDDAQSRVFVLKKAVK
jgi:uncharacterized protein (TIGR03067 family)